jgi:repressor LexA
MIGETVPTLTRRQSQLYNFIKNFIEKKGYSPSYQEMLEHMEVHSKQIIYSFLESLQKHNKIKKIKHMARSIEIL